jgi:hypothetical protein
MYVFELLLNHVIGSPGAAFTTAGTRPRSEIATSTSAYAEAGRAATASAVATVIRSLVRVLTGGVYVEEPACSASETSADGGPKPRSGRHTPCMEPEVHRLDRVALRADRVVAAERVGRETEEAVAAARSMRRALQESLISELRAEIEWQLERER